MASPRPWQPNAATPIGECRGWFIRPRCRCGHVGTYKLDDLARMYGLRLTVAQIGHRLRCKQCQQKPYETELLSSIDPHGMHAAVVIQVRP